MLGMHPLSRGPEKTSIVTPDGGEPLLELQGLTRSFGAVRVIEQLHLQVRRGELLGVLGPNGAGKSTLFNLVTGTLAASAGKVLFEGQNVTGWSAWQRCRMGMGRTYQIPKPFRNMTVFEGVLVAAAHARGLGLTEAKQVAWQALELSGLAHRSGQFAGDLSLLELKRLELARALAVQPRLLLLDEIAGGLTEAECDQLLDIVRSLRDRGITIIWIEHVLHALQRVATRLAVLHGGAILAEGEPAAVLADARVRDAYLGT